MEDKIQRVPEPKIVYTRMQRSQEDDPEGKGIDRRLSHLTPGIFWTQFDAWFAFF